MNICFVSNYDRTIFYYKVSKILNNKGINTFWIVTRNEYYNYLTKQVSRQNILYLPYKYKNCEIRNEQNKFVINDLINNDRTLKYDLVKGKNYLNSIINPVYNFIKNNHIRFIFGELTWAHEILIKRIAETLSNVKYFNPHTVRYPDNRFAFFTDEYQSKIFNLNNNNLNENYYSFKKPEYLNINNNLFRQSRSLKSRLLYIINYITNRKYDPEDPTNIHSRMLRGRIRLRQEINKELFVILMKNRKHQLNKVEKKIVFYPLHKQPEHSIDVVGRYYENQYQNIMNIYRIIPNNYCLVIKEHVSAIGDRTINWYNKILKYPNIYLINEDIDSYHVIDQSEFVVVVSGTAALEAALMGKKSITLVPMFFNCLDKCVHASLDDFRNYGNIELLYNKLSTKNGFSNNEYIKYIYKNSYQGYLGGLLYADIIGYSQENIYKVSNAFIDFLLNKNE